MSAIQRVVFEEHICEDEMQLKFLDSQNMEKVFCTFKHTKADVPVPSQILKAASFQLTTNWLL